MAPRELFKVAFLRCCADQGLSAAETAARARAARERIERGELDKAANWPLLLSGLGALGKGLAVDLPKSIIGAVGPAAAGLGVTAAVGLPLGAGVLAGAGLQRATGSDASVEEAKANELIEEYQRLAEQARRHAAQRLFARKVLPSAGRRL